MLRQSAWSLAVVLLGALGTGACALTPPPIEGRDPIHSSLAVALDPEQRVQRFQDLVERQFETRPGLLQPSTAPPVTIGPPSDFQPWWGRQQEQQLLPAEPARVESLVSLYDRAFKHSTQIKVFAEIPMIRGTGIDESQGRYVTRAFSEGRYQYTNDPVGNTLTTGGPLRFQQDEVAAEVGLRKRFELGTEVTLSQRFTETSNNSNFFIPNPQSKSRYVLSVVQPLLKNAGIEYNRGVLKVAVLDTQIARHEFIRQAESHVVEINRAYWNLYLSRVLLLQKTRLVDDTAAIVKKLEDRQGLDVERVQLIRARAALADRRADLVRSRIAIENAGNKLRALLNDPELEQMPREELIPGDRPQTGYVDISLKDVVRDAIRHRAEVRQAYLQYEAAGIRQGMATNEILPNLDLVLEGSQSGLGTHRRVGAAFDNAVASDPGGLIGLRFEIPLGREEAWARLARRQREMRQQANQLQTTVNTIVLEAQVSVAEYTTGYSELQSRIAALEAANEDLRIVEERWLQGLGRPDQPGVVHLESLLDAQSRRAAAEERLVFAQGTYMVAIANLERAKGTFLQVEGVQIIEDRGTGKLPELRLERKPKSP